MTPQLHINFLNKNFLYRLQRAGKNTELLAKAVGIKSNYRPTVIDATAGLGRDAFILAYLGCKVIALERNSIIAEKLQNALNEFLQNQIINREISLQFIHADAKKYLTQSQDDQIPQVIYLDPMYPERTKSALVKQEMRLLKEIVGDDDDANELLNIALQYAKNRVVVKRPSYASALNDLKPDFVIEGKNQRFDVYLCTK